MDIANLGPEARRIGLGVVWRPAIAGGVARIARGARRIRPDASEVAVLEPVGRTWSIVGVASDARIVQLACLSTLILLLGFNHVVVQAEYTRFALQFVIPMSVVVLLWRENPRLYGLGIGNWRIGLPVALGTMAVMAGIVWLLGQTPEFRDYYRPLVHGRSGPQLLLDSALDLLAWEFFCRGWLLFGLARKYGTDAIWLQIVPFALMHLHKPELEQLSTIVGGAFFGLLAWRTRSCLYGWLIHIFILTLVMAVSAGYI